MENKNTEPNKKVTIQFESEPKADQKNETTAQRKAADVRENTLKTVVQENVSQLQAGSKKSETGGGKKIFIGFVTIILGLSFLFYGLFLWSLLKGNLSNPLFDTIGLNPADLKDFMKNTTNILFGGLALIFLIMSMVKLFQWSITPKEDYNKPRFLKLSGIYIGFLILFSTVWGILFLLIGQADVRNVQTADSLIVTTPANVRGISAPQVVTFDIGEKLFAKIPAKNVKQILWDLNGDDVFDEGSGQKITYEFLNKGSADGKNLVQAKVLYIVPQTNTEKEYVDSVEVLIANESVRADLAATPVLGQSPLSVHLSAEKSTDPDGSIVLYEWDLDDDNDFELKGVDKTTVDKVFDTIGDHIVRLRVTGRNNDYSITETKIVVTEPDEKIRAEIVSPDAKFEGTAPFKVTLDGSQSFAKNGSITSFKWEVEGEKRPILNRKLARTFSVPGTYKIALTVENAAGEKDQQEQIITVYENIQLAIKTAPEATKEDDILRGAVPFEVVFDGTDSSVSKAVEWRWDFENDGIVDVYDKKARHVFRDAGIYDVLFTIVDENNQTFEKTQRVEVVNMPLLAKISSDKVTGTAPLVVKFDASGSKTSTGRIINYIWEFPKTDPINSNAQIIKEFDRPGLYKVKLTIVTEEGDSATDEILVSVIDQPVKAVVNSNLVFGKAPLVVKFDGSDSIGDLIEWKWDFGDEFVSTEINPVHRYDKAGVYSVLLRVKDSKGLLDESKIQIVVE